MAEARTAGDGRSTFKIASLFTYDFLRAWWPRGSWTSYRGLATSCSIRKNLHDILWPNLRSPRVSLALCFTDWSCYKLAPIQGRRMRLCLLMGEWQGHLVEEHEGWKLLWWPSRKIKHDIFLHSFIALKIWFYSLLRLSVYAQLKFSLSSRQPEKHGVLAFYTDNIAREEFKSILLQAQGVSHRLKSQKCNRNSNKKGVTQGQSSQKEHHKVETN